MYDAEAIEATDRRRFGRGRLSKYGPSARSGVSPRSAGIALGLAPCADSLFPVGQAEPW